MLKGSPEQEHISARVVSFQLLSACVPLGIVSINFRLLQHICREKKSSWTDDVLALLGVKGWFEAEDTSVGFLNHSTLSVVMLAVEIDLDLGTTKKHKQKSFTYEASLHGDS